MCFHGRTDEPDLVQLRPGVEMVKWHRLMPHICQLEQSGRGSFDARLCERYIFEQDIKPGSHNVMPRLFGLTEHHPDRHLSRYSPISKSDVFILQSKAAASNRHPTCEEVQC